MDRKRAAETTGGRAIYEMVYLNVAMPDGLALFDREEIEACRNQKRDIGHVPHGTRLVQGWDLHPQVIKQLFYGHTNL